MQDGRSKLRGGQISQRADRSVLSIDESVGYWIQSMRVERGVSLEKLAATLEISVPMMRGFEMGIFHASPNMISRISTHLNFPLPPSLDLAADGFELPEI